MWGTGSLASHHTVAFRDATNGQLYVHESTDQPPFTDDYWPPPYGIIRTPYKQWIQQAIKAEYNVDMMFLSDKYQARFDNKKAFDFFMKWQGMPYGFHTFVYEWVDADVGNLPIDATDPEIFSLLFDAMNYWVSNTSKTSVYSILLEGLNNRLNQNFYSMDQMWRYLETQSTSNVNVFELFVQAINMPEQDNWNYRSPDEWCTNRTSCFGKSMVCDVFVANIYSAAGVFGDLNTQILAGEWVPRDLYSATIFNATYTGPKGCDFQGFCQVMGEYQIPLPTFNTIDLYPHMNERCAAVPPAYIRTPTKC